MSADWVGRGDVVVEECGGGLTSGASLTEAGRARAEGQHGDDKRPAKGAITHNVCPFLPPNLAVAVQEEVENGADDDGGERAGAEVAVEDGGRGKED